MNSLEALFITGKLEVRFQGNEQLQNEVTNLQKCISENDFVTGVISLGRISEMVKTLDTDATSVTDLDSLYKFISGTELHDLTEDEMLKITLDDLRSQGKLSVRTFNCLYRAGKQTVGDLVTMTQEDYAKVRNLGKKGFDETVELLRQLGFEIRSTE